MGNQHVVPENRSRMFSEVRYKNRVFSNRMFVRQADDSVAAACDCGGFYTAWTIHFVCGCNVKIFGYQEIDTSVNNHVVVRYKSISALSLHGLKSKKGDAESSSDSLD